MFEDGKDMENGRLPGEPMSVVTFLERYGPACGGGLLESQGNKKVTKKKIWFDGKNDGCDFMGASASTLLMQRRHGGLQMTEQGKLSVCSLG